jgi:hypothetical protein
MFLQINPRDLEEIHKLFAVLGTDAPRALVRTINKTLPGARTDMTQAIYDRYNVTKTKIRGSFSIARANLLKPSGTVATKGQYLNLIEYGATQTQKGVSVRILRAGERKLFPGGFIRTMKNGKELALTREYHATKVRLRPGFAYGKLPSKYRLPVKSLFGPRIQDVLEKPAIWSIIEWQATERLLKAAVHETEYLIQQRLEAGDGFEDT